MLAQYEKKKVPILMYHSISDYAAPKFQQFAVSPALFARQMAYLNWRAYTPMTVTQFLRVRWRGSSALPQRPVILTFDDGFADFYTSALPVLKYYGFTATLYITTGFINGTSQWLQREGETARPMLTWAQIKDICANGIECGAHSHSHRQLDTLPAQSAQDEIVHSKRLLEYHLKQEVLSFAYPFGYYSASVQQQVRQAGYTSACAVKYAMSSETTDPFALARLIVKPDTSVDALAALLNRPVPSVVTTMYIQARAPLWQFARRSMQHLQERL